ncbi:MAG: HlyD family secretion protein [Flavobacteriaceae bacterium]|jgi:HlyD family secretion protein|nr:HlyD family secretion protein [Flavobacteriaceae bacterium]
MSDYNSILYTVETLYYRNKIKGFSLYLAVLLTVAVVFALLPVIKVDISTQSRGLVRTVSENVPISTMVSGRVISVNLRNNQIVKKGEVLLTLETAPLDVQTNTNETLRTDFSALLSDLERVTSGKPTELETAEIQREYQAYIRHTEELKTSLTQAQRVYKRNKSLYDQGVISASEMEKYEYDLQAAQTALRTAEQQQYARWQTQKREALQQIKNYDGSIKQIEADKKNYTITAPISGSIVNFNGMQKGAFLNASQTIAEISASDGLLVETYVSPDDIGLIRKGQVVNFQMDAYNYNQWGLLTGKVTDIDSDVTVQGDNAFFKVRCLLNKDYLQLKNGYKGHIKKGMSLTARFIIDRRSLWNLLYDQVDDWMNPKVINDEQ